MDNDIQQNGALRKKCCFLRNRAFKMPASSSSLIRMKVAYHTALLGGSFISVEKCRTDHSRKGLPLVGIDLETPASFWEEAVGILATTNASFRDADEGGRLEEGRKTVALPFSFSLLSQPVITISACLLIALSNPDRFIRQDVGYRGTNFAFYSFPAIKRMNALVLHKDSLVYSIRTGNSCVTSWPSLWMLLIKLSAAIWMIQESRDSEEPSPASMRKDIGTAYSVSR